MNELDLVERFRGGDQSAFEPLYEMYIDKAVRVAYLTTHQQQAAEDAAQEAFLQVMTHIGSLRSPNQFRSWFFSILINAARRLERRSRRWIFFAGNRSDRDQVDVDTPGPVEAALLDDEIQITRAALRELGDKHRIPLILRYYAELSEVEIAATLEMPVGTVKSRLHNARKRLGEILEHSMKGGNRLAAGRASQSGAGR